MPAHFFRLFVCKYAFSKGIYFPTLVRKQEKTLLFFLQLRYNNRNPRFTAISILLLKS